MKRLIYSPAALSSIEDILEWTVETLGDAQAERHRFQLAGRLRNHTRIIAKQSNPPGIDMLKKRFIANRRVCRNVKEERQVGVFFKFPDIQPFGQCPASSQRRAGHPKQKSPKMPSVPSSAFQKRSVRVFLLTSEGPAREFRGEQEVHYRNSREPRPPGGDSDTRLIPARSGWYSLACSWYDKILIGEENK